MEPTMDTATYVSQEELASAAAEEAEPGLTAVVLDMLDPHSLPPTWSAHYDAESTRRIYTCEGSPEPVWEHPRIAYYRGVVYMERGGLAQMLETLDSDPPTAEDTASMREFLGIVDDEDQSIQDVAMLVNAAPLPDGYVEMEHSDGTFYFKHLPTGKEMEEHPMDPYFRELLRRRRKQMAEVAAASEDPRAGDIDIHGIRPQTDLVVVGTSLNGKTDDDAEDNNPDALDADASVHSDNPKDQFDTPFPMAPMVHGDPSQIDTQWALFPETRQSTLSDPGPRAARPRAHVARGAAPSEHAPGAPPGLTVVAPDSALSGQAAPRPGDAATTGTCTANGLTLAELLARVEAVKNAAGSRPSLRASVDTDALDGLRTVTVVRRRALSFAEYEEAISAPTAGHLTYVGDRPGQKEQRENISVAIRCRPASKNTTSTAWQVLPDQRKVVLTPEAHSAGTGALLSEVERGGRRVKLENFEFDRVFNEEATTRQVYQTAAQPIVLSALDGVNGSVMTYGQTGSGKTYTMIGDNMSVGLLTMALMDLLTACAARSEQTAYTISASLMELYNEQVQDLFLTKAPVYPFKEKKPISIQEDSQRKMTIVTPMTEIPVTDMHQVVHRLRDALKRRSVAATNMNEQSSRAHTIFRLNFVIQDRGRAGRARVRYSTLTFVDLAGSERLKKSESTGVRAAETAHINLSLLMLGNVIAKLADGRKRSWLPFRNSKLTRLLQSHLGGNSRAVFIATIHPGQEHAEETASTLRFAARAMDVQNMVRVNESLSQGETVRRLGKELDALMGPQQQRKIKQLELENQTLHDEVDNMEADKARLMDRVEQLTGEPMGGVSAPIPLLPATVHINLPAGDGHRKADVELDEKRALASIVRMAYAGGQRAATDFVRQGRNFVATPAEAMAATRKLRAERDALRAKLMDLLPRVNNAAQLSSRFKSAQEVLDAIEKHIVSLEDLTGGHNPAVSDQLIERMEEVVGAAAIVNSELRSLQRQHMSLQFLLQSAQERLQGQGSGASGNKETAELRRQLEMWAGTAHLDPMSNSAFDGEAGAGGTGRTGEAHSSEAEPAYAMMGNASIRIARIQHAKATRLERQLAALQAEHEELERRMQELSAEVAATVPELPAAEQAAGGGAVSLESVRQLKTRCSALAAELATLSRERNLLLDFVLGQSDTGLAPQDVINKLFAERHSRAMPVKSNTAHHVGPALMLHPEETGPERSTSPVPLQHRPAFDAKPVAAQVSNHLVKVQDRALKGHLRKSMARSSGKVTSGEGDWDGGSRPDAHTTEVASLKRRLVASERARIELATQVAAERRAVQLQLTNSQRTGEAIATMADSLRAAEVIVAEKDSEARQLKMERDAAVLELTSTQKALRDLRARVDGK